MDTPEQEVWLQRYVDGDLSAEEQAQMQQRLANEPSLAEELANLRRLHDLVVTAGEYRADQLDSEALFARISAAAEPEVVSSPRAEVKEQSSWKRFLHGFWMPAGSALAVAAAMLLTFYLPVDNTALNKKKSEPAAAPKAEQPVETASKESPSPAALPKSVNSEVVQVDFGDNGGTVFDIALAGGASTPVVWINDEEE